MSDICAIPDMYNCFLSDEEHSELIEQLDLPIEPYIFDFDECSRIWNSNKIKSSITGYYTYKDGATEIKQKIEKIKGNKKIVIIEKYFPDIIITDLRI